MQGNNFFFNSDPLLGSTGYDAQYQEIERMQQALENKKRMMQQAKEQMSQSIDSNQSRTPVWDEIEGIISNMTDKEFEIVTSNEEFIESQNVVMSILQSKYMQMMRPVVEGSQEGKDALEKHLTLVKRLRKSAASEVDKEISDFQEYKERYSDMTYSEYQKMKREKKQEKMTIEDLNKFKGSIKSAFQDWGNAKIEEMVPKRVKTKAFLKNGLNNLLSRHDANLNKWIDGIFLFVADEEGTIDSDVMIDTLADMFKEMPKKGYSFGSLDIVAGDGEFVISFPRNFLVDMLVGDMGSVKFTTEDILDFKNYLIV